MNLNLEAFITDARNIAAERDVRWEISLDDDGIPISGEQWNLTRMVKESPPPMTWLNDLGTDRKAVEMLNSSPSLGPQRTYSKRPLSPDWQNLIKACVIDQMFVRCNTCSHTVENVVRPLRVLATCAAKAEPWSITVDDAVFAIQIARQIQPSGKLADLIFGIVRNILDPNHLTDQGPLAPALERDKKAHGRASKFGKTTSELRADLSERKNAEKLPGRKAFWELVRIVFTEAPKSFLDFLLFAQAKIFILTGFRDLEGSLVPVDWKRFRDYVNVNGKPADTDGGISRSLMMRHFAGKQRVLYKDSVALFETVQHIPLIFEEILTEALDAIVSITEPLRKTLRLQVETGRVLPQFEKGDLIRIVELYTYLTGNPLFMNLPEDTWQKYVTRYQLDYNPEVLEELRLEQLGILNSGVGVKLNQTTYTYLNRFTGVPLRTANGAIWEGKKEWARIYVRIDEVEKFLARELPTKQSDVTPLLLADGEELAAWQLLFLAPKRALSDAQDNGLCDVTRYCAIGRMDPGMIRFALCDGENPTLFAKYGQTDEDRALTLLPHSLRHLQNTELFRLGVADTIITKRFNRRSVAQSYEYDHRSLAESLNQTELKPELELRLGEKGTIIAKLMKAGKARGPIVDAFKRIQQKEGEDAAFEYLRGAADGFHSTHYGTCLANFFADSCKNHLECFNGCKHLVATGLSEDRENLVQLESRLEAAVQTIEARKLNVTTRSTPRQLKAQLDFGVQTIDGIEFSAQPVTRKNIGLENQLSHGKSRLAAVKKLLATPPGHPVFPDGSDLSRSTKGTVLDDIL